jgi:hypothetical protein
MLLKDNARVRMDFGTVGIMDGVPVINLMVVVFGLVMIQAVVMGNTLLGVIQVHIMQDAIAMIRMVIVRGVVDMITDI